MQYLYLTEIKEVNVIILFDFLFFGSILKIAARS
jgi:hypothetical protein